MARVVVGAPNQACPGLNPAGQKPFVMTPRINHNPSAFPIAVCEAAYPVGKAAKIDAVALPAVSLSTPDRVVVLGDSGCKNNDKQACIPASWPLAALAKTAAGEKPDLLIHVGDYNYRGTPSTITVPGQAAPVYVYDADEEDGSDPSPPTPYYSQNMAGALPADGWRRGRRISSRRPASC
jgi:hypothetical protein